MASSHVREYVKRVASIDLEAYPKWDIVRPLPRLPVPDLKDTLQRYLTIIRPIVSEQQYETTRQIVSDFGRKGGEGEYLQEKLKELSQTKENWAYNWWLDDMYMKVRSPLPVNSNPGMVLPTQVFNDQSEQLRFAARLISGILDYKTIIDARGLPVDRARSRDPGQPLCMEQYYRLFTAYRVPGISQDSLITNCCRIMPEPEHIIVICRNQFFVLDVIINFTRLSEDNLVIQLERIIKMADEGDEADDAVGVLTSLDRTRWAGARMKLMETSTNRDCLDLIERCIFVLCLDSSTSENNFRDDTSIATHMLHGNGSRNNSCNRWFDKTMQFIIRDDGSCGLCYEHSPAEGIAVVQLVEHLLRYMEEVRRKKLRRMQSICELPFPRKLHWKINQAVRDDISYAKEQIDKLIENLDLHILRFTEFGREFPKTQNMSPDAFIQLALQLTYYKINGKLVSTYESASTRRFHLGRVDNIRANSPACLEWVRAMVGETQASDAERLHLLRKAISWQTDNLVTTILGHGMDCHLLGLKEMANELNLPLNDFFTDHSFVSANQFTLSTSQVPTTTDAFMCYGPVVHNGYGCCYNPHPNYIIVCVASFKNSSETSSEHFTSTLECSFLQMHELCLKTSENNTTSSILKTEPVVTSSISLNNNNNNKTNGILPCSESTIADFPPKNKHHDGLLNGGDTISQGVHQQKFTKCQQSGRGSQENGTAAQWCN